MPKELMLVIPGAGDESIGHTALIEEETTVAELLLAANLNPSEWQLQRRQGEDFISLSNEDKLASHVHAGEKVFASPNQMVVGLGV